LVEGDITSKLVVIVQKPDGEEAPFSVAKSTMYTLPGLHTIVYTVLDGQRNAVSVKKTINIIDPLAPTIKVLQSNPWNMECGANFSDPSAVATDPRTQVTVPILSSGGVNRSCFEIRRSYPTALSGQYDIQSAEVNSGNPLSVYCDMETNGGGYTYYQLTGTQTCAGFGLQPLKRTNMADISWGPLNGAQSEFLAHAVGQEIAQSDKICSTNDKGFSDCGVFSSNKFPGSLLGHGFPKTRQPGSYDIRYSALSDGRRAIPLSRRVEVLDTTKPAITLHNNAVALEYVYIGDTDNLSLEWTADMDCEDMCSPKAELLKEAYWAEGGFNATKSGTYKRIYKCTDMSGNHAYAQKTIVLIPVTAPVVRIVGDNPTMIEAKKDTVYMDIGATCQDSSGTYINQLMYVSGEIVNQASAGTYEVFYACTDAHGNEAISATRVVIVADTGCPQLQLLDESTLYIEAGFEYVDAGCSASDSLDGDISSRVITMGSTVNTANAFYSVGSCLEIQSAATRQNITVASGYYFITVNTPSSKTKRIKVYCDFVTDGGGYTYYAVENGNSIGGEADNSTCAEHGMQVVVPRSAAHFSAMTALFDPSNYFSVVPGVYGKVNWIDPTLYVMNSNTTQLNDKWLAVDGGAWFLNDAAFAPQAQFSGYTAGCWLDMFGWDAGDYKVQYVGDGTDCVYSTTNYICSTNDKGGPGVDVTNSSTVVDIHAQEAEPGKYVISYHVVDSSGNTECSIPKRTVIVMDRLAPVISVKLNGKTVIDNPLTDATGNVLLKKSLMELGVEHEAYHFAVPAVAALVAGIAVVAHAARTRRQPAPGYHTVTQV
jgi:hypothetical protein